MTLVGCDLHTRKQQVAVLDTETGEMYERQLSHAGDAVEQFYRALPGPVTVGIESTGYALWFHELMQRSAWATRCSWARPRRFARWSCARRRPTAATRTRRTQRTRGHDPEATGR
jgi:hypothetical protein